MKVLHVIPSLSLKLGGPTQAVINFVYYLQQKGIDAEVATTNDNGQEVLNIPLEQKISYQGIPVLLFPRSARFKEFIPSISLTRWLLKNIDNYDIVHTHYLFSYAPTVAAYIAQQKSIPYVVSTIGQLTPWALAQGHFKKRLYSNVIERRNLNRATAIHCTTGGEAQDVQNFGIATRKLVIPLGVIPLCSVDGASRRLRNRYQIPDHRSIVLYLSRLHYKKRPDLLIEALGNLIQDGQEAHLILAGSGDAEYCKYLGRLVKCRGCEKYTTFAGFVQGENKDLLLQGADIFALPSFSENFGIAVVEAMAAGLPVIITEGVQLAPDVSAARAGLVISSSLDALQAALTQLITDPLQRRSLGQNGRVLAQQRYHWPVIAEQLASSYTEIITHKSLPGSCSLT